MMPNSTSDFFLDSVTQSLNEFQQLFSRIYDAILYGPNQRGRISSSVYEQTRFDFGFSYPGSLGVALMVPGDNGLFGDKFDDTVAALLQITEIQDDHEVRDLSKELGHSVVKKTYDWAKVNYHGDFDIGLRWSGLRTSDRGGIIDLSVFGKLVEVIERTSDKDIKTLKTHGILLGIDTDKGRFNFYSSDEFSYSGVLSDEFPRAREWVVNHRYEAVIQVEEVTEYATQVTKESFSLENLVDQTA
jgi:hypothetical protein